MIQVGYIQGKGRGVLAQQRIACGQIIERAPVVILPGSQWKSLEKTALKDYYFLWDKGSVAIALGYGSLYNHSYSPNATFVLLLEERIIEFVAVCDIEPGEEICINYNGPTDDDSPVWFVPCKEEHNKNL